MTGAEHDRFADLTGLYVLDALEPAERAAFEGHLRACDACAKEVRSLAPVVSGLARAVPRVEPPASLRAGVLAAIGNEVGSESITPLRAPATRGGRGVESRLGWLAAAAALVLAIGLGAQSWQLRGQVSSLEARLAEASARLAAMETEVTLTRAAVGEARLQTAVLASPDLARVDLTGRPPAPAAAGRAFWSRARGLVFTASGLPALPAGRVYQLWVVTADAPVSAGLLEPDAEGEVTVVFETPPDLPQPVAMAVTLEPAGGVPAPTGDMYLVGNVGP